MPKKKNKSKKPNLVEREAQIIKPRGSAVVVQNFLETYVIAPVVFDGKKLSTLRGKSKKASHKVSVHVNQETIGVSIRVSFSQYGCPDLIKSYADMVVCVHPKTGRFGVYKRQTITNILDELEYEEWKKKNPDKAKEVYEPIPF